jgi:glutamate dehydrogenase (NAD(P)+)
MMVWIMDTYMNVIGFNEKNAVRRVVTGKTITSGGSYGRETATGQGVVHCLTEWAKGRRFDLNGATFIVQGFGNVGAHAAKILAKLGATLVGVGDYKGYIANPEGINTHKLAEHVQKTGSVEGYKHSRPTSREEFFNIVNSGGVMVSYYEWLQNKRSERWDLSEVEQKLEDRMKRTYGLVRDYAEEKRLDYRTASYAIGLDRIEKAYSERGIFP